MCALLAAPAANAGTPSLDGENPAQDRQALVRAINEARTDRGLRPLRFSRKLGSGARSFARGMIRRNDFTHRSLRRGLAENRFWRRGSKVSARMVVRAWIRNPTTKANLLSRRAKFVGVGVATGPFSGRRVAVVVVARFSAKA